MASRATASPCCSIEVLSGALHGFVLRRCFLLESEEIREQKRWHEIFVVSAGKSKYNTPMNRGTHSYWFRFWYPPI
jgi:hypothetical protein